MSLSRAVALVTGAGQGLGRATAIRLAAQGAKVVIADISEERASMVAKEIGEDSAMVAAIDVTSESDVASALESSKSRWGNLTVAVNCAGIAPPMRTLSKKGPHRLDQFSNVLKVNTVGTFNIVRLAAEQMSANDPCEGHRGVIINTASIAAMDGQIGQAAYAASKGAVVAMTLPLARDLAGLGIRVNTIAPGLFLTPMLEGLPEQVPYICLPSPPFSLIRFIKPKLRTYRDLDSFSLPFTPCVHFLLYFPPPAQCGFSFISLSLNHTHYIPSSSCFVPRSKSTWQPRSLSQRNLETLRYLTCSLDLLVCVCFLFLPRTVAQPYFLSTTQNYAHLVQCIIENPMLNGETIRLDGALRMQP